MKIQTVKKWLTETWLGKALISLLAVFLWVLVWLAVAKDLNKPVLLPTPLLPELR